MQTWLLRQRGKNLEKKLFEVFKFITNDLYIKLILQDDAYPKIDFYWSQLCLVVEKIEKGYRGVSTH